MKKVILLLVALIFIGLQVEAQKRTVSGTVTGSDDGQPLPGVSVTVKGTTMGVVTNIDGKYSIDVDGKVSLIFSFVGMETKELESEKSTVVDVVLSPAQQDIDEVVVTGYASKGKNSITGSTIQVKGDRLKDIPVVSIDQTLQGKVAGLTISTTSGSPGSVQDIRIRGVGSITAGNDPLIVIDGVPVINSNMSGSTTRSSLSALSAINSNDIESITVLKDASATSAYGARGSNGVIVITTKKGKNEKTKFNFSSTYGFQNKATEGHSVLTAAQREELYLEGLYNSFGVSEGFTKAGAYDWAVANGKAGAYTAWRDAGRPEGNWEDAMKNTNAAMYNVNLSATGGNENSTFYTSLGYNSTESIVVGSEFRRINGSLNYTREFNDKVKFSTSNSVSNTLQDGIILEQSAYFASPILAKYFMSPLNTPYTEDGEINLNVGSLTNYLYLKDNDIAENNFNRFTNNSSLEWEIIDNLKFKTLIGMDYNMVRYKSFGNRNYGDSKAEGGTSFVSMWSNFNIVAQNSLSYNLQFDRHFISALGLIEYQQNKDFFMESYGESFVADGLTNVASAGANKDASSTYVDWMNASYLGMINYEFDEKIIADFTFRREGSSRFSTGNRFGNFWSVGTAWNLHKESFIADMGFFSTLRARVAYGISGNSAIGLNQYQALLGFDADYAGVGAVYPSGYGNTMLTWEKNKNLDAGIDFGLFNEKVSGSFAYFNKYTFDLLQNVPLSRTSGHSSIISNIGEVKNNGFEMTLNFNIIRSHDLNVNLSFNLATLKNEVMKLAKDGEGNDINIETASRKVEVGHALYEWNMQDYAGVNPETGAPQWYLNTEDAEADEVTESYYDAERIYIGASAIPTYSGGTSLHVDFKGVFFDMNLYFAGGHKIYEDWSFYTQHAGLYTTSYYQGVDVLMDRWQEPGDVTDVPIMLANTTANNASRTSTRFLYDGTYMRVKDLVLGYNIPKDWLSKIKFQTASVFVRGTNPLTWVKDERLKYDPEVRADGFTNLTNPPVKSVSFGINLNF